MCTELKRSSFGDPCSRTWGLALLRLAAERVGAVKGTVLAPKCEQNFAMDKKKSWEGLQELEEGIFGASEVMDGCLWHLPWLLLWVFCLGARVGARSSSAPSAFWGVCTLGHPFSWLYTSHLTVPNTLGLSMYT